MLESQFLEEPLISSTARRSTSRQLDPVIGGLIGAEQAPLEQTRSWVSEPWREGTLGDALFVLTGQSIAGQWGELRGVTEVLQTSPRRVGGRFETAVAIFLREDSVRLLTTLSQSSSTSEDHQLIAAFMLSSKRALHTFAELVTEDLITVEEGQLSLTAVAERYLRRLNETSEQRAP